jgi:hypothetical protein
MKYEGLRFRAECRLAGKLYGQAFGVDVASGDPVFGDPETVIIDDLLASAGIGPPVLRLYPVETHIAEKLHAYTMPRERPNTGLWSAPYREMARENELAWTTIEQLTTAVTEFLNPVLAGRLGTWHPTKWIWDLQAAKK